MTAVEGGATGTRYPRRRHCGMTRPTRNIAAVLWNGQPASGLRSHTQLPYGMGRLERLLFGAEQKDIWARLEELQHRYHKKCPTCGNWFWIQPDQIKPSWMDGSFEGYRCPERGCDGFAKWKEERKK